VLGSRKSRKHHKRGFVRRWQATQTEGSVSFLNPPGHLEWAATPHCVGVDHFTGLLAKKAVNAGLNVKPYIKTSLSPGSGVVTYYLRESGVMPYLSQLGFDVVGYGCMTCIGNSGPLPEPVVEAITQGDLVAVGVLSGNRNFEGRVHPNTRANYLASPPLVIAYAIAGTIRINFEKEPLGVNAKGQQVFLKDIWPTRDEIQAVERQYVIPGMFKEVYQKIETVNERWNALAAPSDKLYCWNPKSTYIKSPPFFENLTLDIQPPKSIVDAYVLLNLGDSVTTDHISPAGNIARNSPAARYLTNRGLTPREFNSYGSRRGNDAIMARGTFANIRLLNKFLNKQAPQTIHLPSGEIVSTVSLSGSGWLDIYTVTFLWVSFFLHSPMLPLVSREFITDRDALLSFTTFSSCLEILLRGFLGVEFTKALSEMWSVQSI